MPATMCRRFALDLDWDAVADQFGVSIDVAAAGNDEGGRPAMERTRGPSPVAVHGAAQRPRADAKRTDPRHTEGLPSLSAPFSPHDTIGVITQDRDGVRRLLPSYWSLLPPWEKSRRLPYPTYNARIESIAYKPSYRESTRRMRAIIPCTGYFEFKEGRPFYFFAPEHRLLSLAGLYTWWRPEPTVHATLTTTIITCPAIGGPADVHDRMPLLVSHAQRGDWLDPNVDGADLLASVHDAATRLSTRLSFYETASHRGDQEATPLPLSGGTGTSPTRTSQAQNAFFD
jgi:putative SOS response-associated peptidase YedK